MGTFERIRTLSPWILTAFAVIFILFMAVSGIDFQSLGVGSSNPQTMAIANVNGKEIKYLDYEKQVAQELENRRQQNPDAPIDDKQVRNQMWNTIIDGELTDQYAKKIGSYVTDDVIAYELLTNPPDFMKKRFTDSAGTFQAQIYQELLTDPQTFYAQRYPDMDPTEKNKALQQFRDEINMITNYLKDQKKQQWLTNAVNTATGIVSRTFAKQSYIDENTSADVNYIQLQAASVPEGDIKISDEEIKNYYDKHKASFKQEASRKLKYVAFRIQPSEKDTTNMLKKQSLLIDLLSNAPDSTTRDSIFSEKLRDYNGKTAEFTNIKDIEPRIAQFLMNFNKGDIKGPINTSDGIYFIRLEDKRTGENKVVKASHILIGFGNNKDSAKAEAIKIMKEAKTGNFAELASKYSEDKGSARNGGDLGYFGKGQMVPEFEKAAFAAKVGDVVGPVETQYGYHIIKVEDSKSEEYKYSYIKLTPITSGITKNQIIRDAVSFKKQLEEGADIDDLAKKLGLTVQETAPITKNRPTLTSQYLTDISFHSDKGTVLDPLELDNYGYVVAVVSDVQEKGISPLEVVKDDITGILKTEKALDYQMKKATDIYNKIKGSADLSTVSSIDPSLIVRSSVGVKNNGTIPEGGRDYLFTNTIMNVPLNQITAPFKGDNSVYIAIVTKRTKPSEEQVKNALPNYITQLKSKYAREGYYLWLNQVKKDADIEDMRYKQYKTY
ncbi:hypothetical protein EP342_02935 [bacterium]|nr:MAG: hypothetical protein EP342_02935 [bacterium]